MPRRATGAASVCRSSSAEAYPELLCPSEKHRRSTVPREPRELQDLEGQRTCGEGRGDADRIEHVVLSAPSRSHLLPARGAALFGKDELTDAPEHPLVKDFDTGVEYGAHWLYEQPMGIRCEAGNPYRIERAHEARSGEAPPDARRHGGEDPERIGPEREVDPSSGSQRRMALRPLADGVTVLALLAGGTIVVRSAAEEALFVLTSLVLGTIRVGFTAKQTHAASTITLFSAADAVRAVVGLFTRAAQLTTTVVGVVAAEGVDFTRALERVRALATRRHGQGKR